MVDLISFTYRYLDLIVKYLLTLLITIISTLLSGQCESYDYDNIFDASWKSCVKTEHPGLDSAVHWIQYDLGHIRYLSSTHFWNYNIVDNIEAGAKEIDIYTSVNENSWTLNATDTLDLASGLSTYEGQPGPDLSLISAQHILIVVRNNYGGSCTGLSEVKIDFADSQCSSLELQMELSQTYCDSSISSSVKLTPLGGLGPFSYIWSTGQDSSDIDSIAPGTYEVLIIDSLNCAKSFEIIVDSMSFDTSIFHSNEIGDGTYYKDTLNSSGNVLSTAQVNFLFSSETILQENFSVEIGAELRIDLLDCINDPTSSFNKVKNLVYDLPIKAHTGFIGLGNEQFVTISSSSEELMYSHSNTLNGKGELNELAAARFLSQATLGYDQSMISEVSELGTEEWINQQFKIENESYFNHLQNVMRFDQPNINYWLNFHRTWWHNTLTGDEYLRERVAFALSQIFVISSKSFLLNYGDGLTSYYDMLLNHSFGNYRDLLYDVTMHPTMGFYLSHLNNPKTDASINQFPDENYAREILQLFSIGLYELNIDGTRKKDALNNNIPTYNNQDIIEFAKIFTGLGFSNKPFGTPVNSFFLPMTEPMIMNEEYHEEGVKHLLNGESILTGQAGMQDINDALDNIFNHPNVGPFIATRLIQRLVKSEPSPEYVQRVAETFNDNGQGIRGDLKAVVKSILLDMEARDCSFLDDPTHGMLREPLLRIIHLLKAFNISNNTQTFYALGEVIETFTSQAPLRAPSVFNFYQSDHTAPGVLSDSMIRSPEFGILDSYSSIGYINLIDSISSNIGLLDVEEGSVFLDFTEELNLTNNANDLIDLLDQKLTYGHLSERVKNIIKSSLTMVGTDPVDRVKMAIYIIANSPDFTILR